ncbi:RNA-splicing factor [Mortierella claussenii]|nr:RNA-splicing factor [Mortierella claussenii]
MGGGDLNLKKSWHPGTFRNQEKVWKEERKAADEEKKLQQLRKELEEERQIQELQRIQEQAGGKKRSDRLDWMYQAAPTGGQKDEKALEDFLLGKRRVDEILNKRDGGAKALSRESDAFMNQPSKANSIRDIQAKVREDPLLAIKRQEQSSMELLMKNPIRMRQLKESREGKDSKKKKSKKSKEDKADKIERRRDRSERHGSKRRSSRDGSRASDTDDSRDDRIGRSSRKHHRHSDPHDKRSPDRTFRKQDDAYSSKTHYSHGQRHSQRRLSASRSPSPDARRPPRESRRRSRSRSMSPQSSRRRSRSPPYHHASSRSSRRDQSRSPSARTNRSRSRNRSRSPSRYPIRPHSPVSDRYRGRYLSPSRTSHGHDGPKTKQSPLRRPNSGHSGPTPAPREQKHAEEEANHRAALAEERERRLKAMTEDASADALARKARLAEIAEIEANQDAEDEAKRQSVSKGGQAAFLKSAQKSAYDGMSLADRVQRGRATLQSV